MADYPMTDYPTADNPTFFGTFCCHKKAADQSAAICHQICADRLPSLADDLKKSFIVQGLGEIVGRDHFLLLCKEVESFG